MLQVTALCLLLLFSAQAAQGQESSPTPTAEVVEQVATTATPRVEPDEHNVLHRPIELADDKVHWPDRTYPYGSTQQNARAVHLGVEFVNPLDTPVYAAMAGVVIFAGSDADTLIGPQLNYYGNVVVLKHELDSREGRQVFSLYAHLDQVNVEAGDRVDDLDQIGRIGASGVAIGPHLHFEVRVQDPYDYRMTRNPELWLQHYLDRGMIVGSVRDQEGNPLYGKRLTLRSDTADRDVYTYGSDLVNTDPAWRENFAIGDLPAGEYEIIVLDAAGTEAFGETINVEAYRSTVVHIVIDDASIRAVDQR